MDPGADCSIIGEEALKGREFKKVAARWSAITGVEGVAPLQVLYGAHASLSVGAKTVSVVLAVVPHLSEEIILGVDVLEPLGVLGPMREAIEALGVATIAVAKGAESQDDRAESEEAILSLDLSHIDDVPAERDRLRAALLEYRDVFVAEGRLPHAARVPPAQLHATGGPTVVPARTWNADTRRGLESHEELLVKEGLASG